MTHVRLGRKAGTAPQGLGIGTTATRCWSAAPRPGITGALLRTVRSIGDAELVRSAVAEVLVAEIRSRTHGWSPTPPRTAPVDIASADESRHRLFTTGRFVYRCNDR